MILCEDYNKTFKNYRIVDSKYFMYNDQLLLELENDIELKTIPPHKVSKCRQIYGTFHGLSYLYIKN